MDLNTNNSFHSTPPLSGFEAAQDATQDLVELRQPFWMHLSGLADQDSMTLHGQVNETSIDDFLEREAFLEEARSSSPSAFLLARPSDSISQRRPSNSPEPFRQSRRSTPPSMFAPHSRRDSLFDSPDPDFFIRNDPTPPPNSSYTTTLVDLTSPSQTTNNVTISSGLLRTSRGTIMSSTTVKRRLDTQPEAPDAKRPRHGSHDIEEVDLRDVEDDEDYAAFSKRTREEAAKQKQVDEANKPIKLSEFQCIICLDNPTDLTVTWCGHLFCSQCLHEALHAGTQKKVCPICRQTISTNASRKKDGKMGPPKNGVFPLSMKLMTAKKKGKQAER